MESTNRRKTILAIVVTYYPNADLLRKNISAFELYVDKILIWENTPQNEKEKYRFASSDKIIYCGDGTNSISRALNYGWSYARERGYDYLLTMDQDSCFKDFGNYLENTAYSGTAPYGIYIPRLSFHKGNNERYEIKYRSITSGMLVPILILDQIGGYRDDFIIDGIDFDICWKARRKGIDTYRVNECIMNHHLGDEQKRHFLGKAITIYNYGPKRLYEITKNHLIVLRENFKYIPSGVKKDVIRGFFVMMPLKIVLFEDNKICKIKACAKGLKEGLFCKLSI